MHAVTHPIFLAFEMACLTALCPALTAASETVVTAQQSVRATDTDATASNATASNLGTPVSLSALASQRGGSKVENDNDLSGKVSDNSARNVATGANSIQDGSFTNASGITTVVQNTGANVLIQSATIVNVQFSAP